jgi:hypothetical protein
VKLVEASMAGRRRRVRGVGAASVSPSHKARVSLDVALGSRLA